MLRYQRGELAAFEQLYRRHRGGSYRYLLRGCGNEDIAAELFQDVWASVVRSRSRYEVKARFATWLYKLAHNRLIDHYRAARAGQEPLDDTIELAAPAHLEPEAQAQSVSTSRRLLQALGALPSEQREAFLMKEEGGLSLEQIAEVTGVGRETVKSRLRYALSRLRGALADVL
ncbi:MAG: polymerase sigma factor [Hydrocarboniphaga sp.]|uniref:RNA polymerase sigma factor n=1 Tax=Hydrocarboniphaga sp. TaxID=2033016 RepID=UPI002615E817|nr:RNA polymerase sigma factor [Hydrocarboniphaga sp.]MDB5967622.1 polymerase sigma factor [Hydrocarboniphaga sp.]